VLEFTATAPDAFVTARNRDRTLFQPWGVLGGRPGANGSFTLNPGTNHERDLGNTDALRLSSGDVLRIVSPAGGGRGDPFTRDPAAVLRDVQSGLVSVAGALRDYGVVIADGAVDVAATAAVRADAPASSGFAPGAARIAHEQRWDAAAYAAMHERLATLPVSWRSPVKTILFAAVREATADEPAAAVIARAFTAYVERAGKPSPSPLGRGPG
jgi:N-methylhydantoinase B